MAFTPAKCADDLRRRKKYYIISGTKEDNVIKWTFRYYSGLSRILILLGGNVMLKHLSVRLTDEELEYLRKKAKEDCSNISIIVRRLINIAM